MTYKIKDMDKQDKESTTRKEKTTKVNILKGKYMKIKERKPAELGDAQFFLQQAKIWAHCCIRDSFTALGLLSISLDIKITFLNKFIKNI